MPDEPQEAKPSPPPPKPPVMLRGFLQGGPLHGRAVLTKEDQDELEMDLENKSSAIYKRSPLVGPDGARFDYQVPTKEPAPPA